MVSTVSRIRRISVDLLVYLYIIEIGDWNSTCYGGVRCEIMLLQITFNFATSLISCY